MAASAPVQWWDEGDLFPGILEQVMDQFGVVAASVAGWNLVSERWATLLHGRQAAWKQACIDRGIPLVSAASPDAPPVDWHAHYLSASKSYHTRLELLRAVFRRESVCMTGAGGVGKSKIIETLYTGLKGMNVDVHVTAMTGAAADLIGGTTLHRFFGTGYSKEPVEELIRKVMTYRGTRARICAVQVLIIDEVSMLSRALFEKFDAIARHVRRNPHKLFGGIQVIASGDFFQIPPIADRDVPRSDQFVFQSPIWEAGITSVFNFEHIYRSADPVFSQLLARARRGELTADDNARLAARVGAPLTEARALGIVPTRMHSHTASVIAYNQQQLDALPSAPRLFDMLTTSRAAAAPGGGGGDDESGAAGAVPQFAPARAYAFKATRAENLAVRNCPVPPSACYKDGARVILVTNLDPDNGFVNGSCGVVVDAQHARGVVVKFVNGKTRLVEPHEWQHKGVLGDRNELADVTVKQMPLVLGWAATVHRAQGMTLDAVEVELGESIFNAGMGYVVLSRVRTLDSLSFLDFRPDSVYADTVVRAYYDYVAETGTHTGFLAQVNSIAFPLLGEMRALMKSLPEVTAARDALMAAREAEIAARETVIEDADFATAYRLRMEQWDAADRVAETKKRKDAEAAFGAAAAAATRGGRGRGRGGGGRGSVWKRGRQM